MALDHICTDLPVLGLYTATTLGQYSPVQPSRLISKNLILLSGERHCEIKVSCLRTQQNDLARSQTQTS